MPGGRPRAVSGGNEGRDGSEVIRQGGKGRRMLLANERARRAAYPADLRAVLSIERAEESRGWLATWPALSPGPTPLWRLPALAHRLDLGRVSIKDESVRATVGSFKALGAPIALVRLLLWVRPDAGYTPETLLQGRHAAGLDDLTVITATDGNHGRALAAAARDVGCRCVIVLHEQVSQEREQGIARFGAQIVRVAGNYDASVRAAADLAAANGWHVVSDTAYPGYEAIPRDVMQGYAIIAAEALEQAGAAPEAARRAEAGDACPFTHVFLQGGVGGLAAGVVSSVWERYGALRPTCIVVEPEQADCLLQSAAAGRPARASGAVNSVMAGLACGEASPLAWRFLQPAVDFFQTVSDDEAVAAMRVLAAGEGGEIPVVSGESGAAGLAGLLALATSPALRLRAGLDGESHVLLVSTEGATAQGVYEALVGESATDVLARQRRWLAAASAGL